MKSLACFVGGAALVTVVLAFLVAGSTGATPGLGPCSVEKSGGPYSTIQDAVKDTTCDPINVGAGTFTETVNITRTVTVQGLGSGQTTVDGNADGSVFTIQAGTMVTLTGLTIQSGSAFYGGGIYNLGTLRVSNSTLSGNVASRGGGIDNWGTLAVSDSTLSGNSADSVCCWDYGGGIRNRGALTVSGSTLSGNTTADEGGGIYNWSGSALTVTHSTLSGNSAGLYGGGILNAATLTVTHSTLSGNSASLQGGGIYNSGGGTLRVANSIIADSPSGGDCSGAIISQGYNLDSDGSCGFSLSGDPKLGALRDNGGPTWTHALLQGSPALDAGSCPGATADQRGFTRPVDLPGIANANDGCDIGALEAEFRTCQVPAGYGAIQAAVDAAWCKVIEVAVGTFTETVTIDRSLTVQGQGSAQTVVDGDASGRVFTIQTGAAVTLTGLTIQNGLVWEGSGGGVWNSGALRVTHSTLSGNMAYSYAVDAHGGGIYNSPGSTLTVTHSTLSGNMVYSDLSAHGGGIYNSIGGTLTVIHSTLRGDSANHGGGIYNGGTLAVTHSTLISNTAIMDGTGGGIDNQGTVSVSQSTLSGNTAGFYGGGIYNQGTLTVTHSTLSGNMANSDGGGIWSSGTLIATNSIVANSPNGGDCSDAIASQGPNLDSDGSCGFSLTGDPMLDPLQDNGGPTWTQALLLGSPALDKGSCPGATTDQRGFPRPVDLLTIPDEDDGCDIGAYEFQDVAISGLAASNDGPTVLGQPTAFAAAVTAGTHVSYTWDFGDGGSGSGPTPSHTYGAAGSHTATVTATNSAGSKTATTPVSVDAVISGLSANNDGPTVLGQPTAFAATVTAGTNVSYAWDFGDGGSGSGPNPSHTYAAVGPYTATVTATNSVGSATATTAVTIVDEAISGLSASNDGPTVLGQPATFAASVTAGTNVSYAWDFGDGGSGSGPNPSHTYAAVGPYTATVTATNSVGSATATTAVTVSVEVYLPIIIRK